jgi:hypothetical protein
LPSGCACAFIFLHSNKVNMFIVCVVSGRGQLLLISSCSFMQ